MAITASLAHAPCLKGRIKETTMIKAFEKSSQTKLQTHLIVKLQDRVSNKYKVKCLEVEFITDPQEHPNYDEVYKRFTHLP